MFRFKYYLKWLILLVLMMPGFGLFAQQQMNTADRMLQEEDRLTIGGYAQIDYNQPIGNDTYQNGKLDVHRLVLLFGYKFNEKTKFITEVEFEHVKEVYIEQAFLQYEIMPWLNFRGGLLLIPMGTINEYHEPPTFNGVERPNVDKYIVPTTWREIGAGFAGTFTSAAVSYQLYIVNGFSGYNGSPLLRGSDAFRKGRQKGAESFMSSPNLTFKVNYFGIKGLQLGLSTYSGKTQSTLYNGLSKTNEGSIASADSSVVGLSMLGADLRYTTGGLQIRGQLNYGMVSNTASYNGFTGSDLGGSIFGWYGEIGYNAFHGLEGTDTELIPFIRYEKYNTHASMDGGMAANPSFDRSDITAGIGWKITSGTMLKADYQVFRNKADSDSKQQFNAGIAIWF